MRIDSHHYVTSAHPIEHLAPILERNRFEGSFWIVQPEQDLAPAAHPMIQGFAIDWQRRELKHPKLRAVWLDLASGLPEKGDLAALVRRNLTLDLRLSGEHLAVIPKLIDAAPGLQIVLAEHAWPQGFESLAALLQVSIKAAGLLDTAFRPNVQLALKTFGPHRVMFGSAWPNCLPDRIWKATLAGFTQCIGAQTMETRELLLGENARRIYRLGETWHELSASTTMN